MENTVMPKARHWLAVPAVLFAAALAMGLIAAHTNAITPHEYAAELHLQTAMRTPWLNTAALRLADVASPVGGLIILVLLTAFLLYRRRPVEAASTFLVIAVGWNSSEIAKIIVARHRPPAVHSLAPETGSNSFPSGHMAFAFSLAVAVYFLLRGTRWATTAIVVGTVWTVLVGFSRIYIGAHYPTDVLGSVMVSTAAIVCLTGIWHGWIVGRLHRVPLLDRFGTLPTELSQQA
jgi:membrane-associated phospholipid phosphatase